LAGATLTGTGRVSFFEALGRKAAAARETRGYSERFYQIGDLLVRVTVAGSDGLERFATALSHLCAPPSQDLAPSIVVWAGDPTPNGFRRGAVRIVGRPGRGVPADAPGWFRSYDRARSAVVFSGNVARPFKRIRTRHAQRRALAG
jgi:hypothetical protein